MTRGLLATGIFAFAGASMLGICALLAQTPAPTLWDGIYTAGQAERGKTIFLNTCARCHGMRLEGGNVAPPLTGDSFFADFSGQTVADLVDFIHTKMPQDNPGHISVVTATDLAAFILASNGAPAGAAELAPDPQLLAAIPVARKPKESGVP